MASVKDLKKRISTVKNTQQTTKAMKMVSAAKLRRAQDAIQSNRPYAKGLGRLMATLTALSDGVVNSPFVVAKDAALEGEKKGKVLLVLVSSDRGLCGGFNSNIIKSAQRWLSGEGAKFESVEVAFVGKKAYDFFKTRDVKLSNYFSELSGKVTFAKARKLSAALQEKYLSGEVQEVKIIYNEFKNAATQQVVVDHFLPLRSASTGEAAEREEGARELPADLIAKPDLKQVLELLIAKHFSIHVYRILLDSQASEHGARMSAMENATKNAGEMIRKLTLQYNKQRQAGITKELLEIISGSESQKS